MKERRKKMYKLDRALRQRRKRNRGQKKGAAETTLEEKHKQDADVHMLMKDFTATLRTTDRGYVVSGRTVQRSSILRFRFFVFMP